MSVPHELPPSLLTDLMWIDDDPLAGRYRDALEELGIRSNLRSRFHIDAAGYSPEIAQELKDPHYLRKGILHAHAIIISESQLRGPLVHPSLGYAGSAFREVTSRSRREIASITRREPILSEVRQATTHFATAEQLADLSRFEIHCRTPGGLVRGARKLESMKVEFLESSQRWLDDEFISEMIELADRVREFGELSDRFVSSSHPLSLFFSPAFGGTYVLEEDGASASRAVTHVLTADPAVEVSDDYRSARGRRVAVETLDPTSAAAALERHGIADIDTRSLRNGERLSRIRHWIALDHLLARDADRSLSGLSASEVIAEMRAEPDPPAEYLELEEVARRLSEGRRRIDPDSLTPITRMRLLSCTSTRPDVARFCAHLLAFVDPIDLEGSWHNAKDLFFGRLPELPVAHRTYFASWIDSAP